MHCVMGMPKYVPPYDTKEQYLFGYNYAGPGTNVNRRLREKVQPMNALDAACLQHDLDTEIRGPRRAKTKRQIRASDKRLERKAFRIATSARTSKQDKKFAWVVYYAMRANRWRPSRRE
jgi:hypothetical protein